MKSSLIGVVIISSVGLFFSCMFTTTHKELKKEVDKISNTQTRTVTLSSGKSIRTIFTNNDHLNKPTLVFVHGAPGDSKAFLNYHKDSLLQTKFRIISYDRPGYGYKDGFKKGITLQDQAKVLNEVLDSLKVTNAILFAHSFGGAVALQMSIDYPKRVLSMILAACAVDPENEKYFWFGKFGKWKSTKWALPKQLRIAGDEKYTHVEELKKLEPLLSEVKQSVYVIHGNKDVIVPFENLDYLKRKLINANLRTKEIDKENHFLVWKQYDFFQKLLLEDSLSIN